MTGAVFESDDNTGSSHDADVDAAYDDDDDETAIDLAGGSGNAGGGNERTSQEADVDRAYED